jgi:hypothetical protein
MIQTFEAEHPGLTQREREIVLVEMKGK